MSDIAQLGIDVQVTGAEDARMKLAAAGAEMRRLGATTESLAAKVGLLQTAQGRWRDANGRFVSSVSATSQVLGRLRLEQAAAGFDSLQNRLDPTSAKLRALDNDFRTLNAALVAGAVELSRYEDLYGRLSAEWTRLSSAASSVVPPLTAMQAQINALVGVSNQATASTNRITAATSMFNAGMTRSHRNVTEFGHRIGYANNNVTNLFFQLQDISMMMASGQSPLMLAMQQGTQVAGVFHQMREAGQSLRAGILGALSALLSPMSLFTIAGIAGAAALYQWAASLAGAGEEAEKFDDILSDVAGSVTDLESALNGTVASFRGLVQLGGSYTDTAIRILEVHRQIAASDAAAAIQRATDAAGNVSGLASYFRTLESIRDMSVTLEATSGIGGESSAARTAQEMARAVSDLARELGTTEARAVSLASAFELLQAASSPQEQAAAARALAEAYLSAVGGANNLTESQRNFLRAVMASEEAALRAVQLAERRSEAFAREETALLRQIAMQEAILRFGRESEDVARLSAQHAEEEFVERMRSAGIVGEQLDVLLELYRTQQRLTGEVNATVSAFDSASTSAGRMLQNIAAAASAMSALRNSIDSLELDSVGLEATNRALASGASQIRARAAGRIAAERVRLGPALGSEDAIIRAVARQQLDEYTAAIHRNSEAQERNAQLTTVARTATASRGTGAQEMTLAHREAAAAIDRARRAALSFGEVQAELDAMLRSGAITTAEYAAAVDDLRERLANTDFSDGFLSYVEDLSSALAQAIVAGEDLGDAMKRVFQRMASDLLASGIRSLLMELFSGLGGKSGGGFFGSFFDILFGGFRANGGPVMPSRAYVVGERGPEMFVPSSAGHIVPNEKMGGQGGGTMAITVNVQGANGDRHIETLVQQGVVAGIREYDRLLPDRIGQFTANQRRR